MHYKEPYHPHQIRKRSIGASVKVELISHNRTFKLKLRPDDTVFHPQIRIENSVGEISNGVDIPVVGYIDGKMKNLKNKLVARLSMI